MRASSPIAARGRRSPHDRCHHRPGPRRTAQRRRARARHARLRPARRGARATRSAIADRSGPAPTAGCCRRSWSRTGRTASTSSRASSGPRSWPSCAPTSTPCCRARRSRPTRRSIATDRPAVDDGILKPPYRWARPLSDPVGGTDENNGRHPAAMLQPAPGADAPAWTVELLDGNLHLSDACLRLYGHPGLLARGGVDPGRRLRALQRGDLRQGAGARPLGRLAPGRHDALERSRLGRRRARLQLHDPALPQHGGERRLGAAGQPQARQGRHQEHGGRERLGPHRGRRADAVRCRRHDRDQPPAGARLLRQQLARPAGHA